ncbi:MAG: hypothetical protein L6R48_00280 [Planctomycetes bacterium]|nr:hypothetical protein [Planctomycetota bacterium]
MAMKPLLIAHGEKALVVVVVGLCALEVWTTLDDPSIRPDKASPAEIELKVALIDKALRGGGAPQLKPVPAYLENLQQRFRAEFAQPGQMPWLTAMPDRGPSDTILLYVYELAAPTIEARDLSGSVELAISLPQAVRQGDRRVSDAAQVVWSTPAGVKNSARMVGVLVETRPGADKPWAPVKTKDAPNGILALPGAGVPPRAAVPEPRPAAPGPALGAMPGAAAGPGPGMDMMGGPPAPVAVAEPARGALSLRIDGLESWTLHEFRATLVAVATGATLGKEASKSGYGVLVTAGRVVPENASIDELPWDQWRKGLEGNVPEVVGRFLTGRAGPLPAGMELTPGEQAYLGQPMAKGVPVQVTSDVRFALERIVNDPNGVAQAQVLVTKQFSIPGGGVVWLKEPRGFKVAVGSRLGGPVQVPDPRPGRNGIVNADLSTPFVVAEIRRGVERVYYHELREVPRQGAKGRDLQVVPKKGLTDVVVLRNERSGSTFELVRLGKVPAPAKAGTVTYPTLKGEIDERGEFVADPLAFQVPPLEQPAPVRWEADKGPLAKLREEHPEDRDLYTTDTAYFAFADGRLVWWEKLNKVVRQWPEPAPGAVTAPVSGPETAPPVEPHAPLPPHPGAKPPRGAPVEPMPPGPGPVGPKTR